MKKQDVPLKIAIVGKGGVGKSVITTLLAKALIQFYNLKLLLIDADPSHPHLCNMVNLVPNKSLEQIRTDLIKNASKKGVDAEVLAETIDFAVYNSMADQKNFSLISMGQPEDSGCFCPSNTLLRKVIDSISKDFDVILIDCEAGLEQIHRLVLKSIDVLIIVCDLSLRSLITANTIRNRAKKFTNYKQIGVIINKVQGNMKPLLLKLKELDLPFLGEIPLDKTILEFDMEDKPIINISVNSSSFLAIKKIITKIL